MARHLRIEFPGAIYHISCRMVGQWKDGNAFLFKDDSDRLRLLDRLADRVDQCKQIRLSLNSASATARCVRWRRACYAPTGRKRNVRWRRTLV
jgi:hypothetical protein